MTVKRLLKGKGPFVPVIRSHLLLSDVINQLDIEEVGALVVSDDDSTILGIITEHDIARGLKSYGRNVVDKPLRELMTRDVISVDINASVTKVLELMDQHQIHHLPVTEAGSLAGIINMPDLVKYRLAEIEMEAKVLLRRQIEFLRCGKTGTYERDDHGRQIDTSSQTVKQLEMKITALQSLLGSREMSAIGT